MKAKLEAPEGRINIETVDDELARLKAAWDGEAISTGDGIRLTDLVPPAMLDETGDELLVPIDPFNRVQLLEVLKTCRKSRNLSDAGRRLFKESRNEKKKINDADRLRKYLARFGLDWKTLRRQWDTPM